MSDLLGKRLRDKVTGFEGVATSYTTYLTGCATYGLAPKVDDKGMIQDTVHFDYMRLEVVDDGPLAISTNANVDTGGPRRDAPGRSA
jgi:hypothetical protein